MLLAITLVAGDSVVQFLWTPPAVQIADQLVDGQLDARQVQQLVDILDTRVANRAVAQLLAALLPEHINQVHNMVPDVVLNPAVLDNHRLPNHLVLLFYDIQL